MLRGGPFPLYDRILRDRIVSGQYQEDGRLPTDEARVRD